MFPLCAPSDSPLLGCWSLQLSLLVDPGCNATQGSQHQYSGAAQLHPWAWWAGFLVHTLLDVVSAAIWLLAGGREICPEGCQGHLFRATEEEYYQHYLQPFMGSLELGCRCVGHVPRRPWALIILRLQAVEAACTGHWSHVILEAAS